MISIISLCRFVSRHGRPPFSKDSICSQICQKKKKKSENWFKSSPNDLTLISSNAYNCRVQISSNVKLIVEHIFVKRIDWQNIVEPQRICNPVNSDTIWLLHNTIRNNRTQTNNKPTETTTSLIPINPSI